MALAAFAIARVRLWARVAVGVVFAGCVTLVPVYPMTRRVSQDAPLSKGIAAVRGEWQPEPLDSSQSLLGVLVPEYRWAWKRYDGPVYAGDRIVAWSREPVWWSVLLLELGTLALLWMLQERVFRRLICVLKERIEALDGIAQADL